MALVACLFLRFDAHEVYRRFPKTNSRHVLIMYQMIKDAHELFMRDGLLYWAAAGTLLGAVRHKGLIPWDYDLDIFIRQEDEPLLLQLKNEFSSLGYNLVKKRDFVYFLCKKTAQIPHMDIILTYQNDDKIFYSCEKLQKKYRREKLPLYFTEQELYPLQEINFGVCKVIAPINPHPYLYYAYGSDYLTHAICANNSIKIELSEQDKMPALPLGPLKDRVQCIKE